MLLATAAAEAISQTPFRPHTAVSRRRNAIGNTSVPKKDTTHADQHIRKHAFRRICHLLPGVFNPIPETQFLLRYIDGPAVTDV